MGPQTASGALARKINREAVVLLGWGRAILLQLAHPLVAAGVADYSSFEEGLLGYARRTRRTVGAMLALTFGSETEARAVAGRINAIHDRVHGRLREPAGGFPAGTPYAAGDPRLLTWVHATLVDSLPLAYERFVGPLAPEERAQYVREAAAVGPLFRIPDGWLPETPAALDAYVRRMFASGEIAVSDQARRLSRALLAPPLGPAGAPLYHIARLTTVGLLPPAVRHGYGFAWTPRDERALARATRIIRLVRRWLPPLLREWPAARTSASGPVDRAAQGARAITSIDSSARRYSITSSRGTGP